MYRYVTILLILAVGFVTAACGSSAEETTATAETEAEATEVEATEVEATEIEAAEVESVDDAAEDEQVDESATVIDVAYFDSAGLVSDPQIVDCTLQNGDASQCAEFVTKYLPDNLEIGPFCPETIYEEGGIWEWDGDEPGLYRLNEEFFTMLTEQGYEFYDAEGNVYIGDPAGELVAGVNNCLSATADETVEMTVCIPLQPVMAETPTDLGTVAQVGLAIDAVPIFADAPSVLQTGHLPALDICGGHIDPGGWYHWHATATDIESSFAHEGLDAACHLDQSAATLFGFAFDGYPIYGSADQDGTIPDDLDACSGHTGATADYPDGVYHYHAGLEFPNLPECLVGVSAESAFSTTASAGIGAGGSGGLGGGGGERGDAPDFATAAAALGVSEDALRDALGGPPPDIEAAAETLGITLEELEAALEEAGVQVEQP